MSIYAVTHDKTNLSYQASYHNRCPSARPFASYEPPVLTDPYGSLRLLASYEPLCLLWLPETSCLLWIFLPETRVMIGVVTHASTCVSTQVPILTEPRYHESMYSRHVPRLSGYHVSNHVSNKSWLMSRPCVSAMTRPHVSTPILDLCLVCLPVLAWWFLPSIGKLFCQVLSPFCARDTGF